MQATVEVGSAETGFEKPVKSDKLKRYQIFNFDAQLSEVVPCKSGSSATDEQHRQAQPPIRAPLPALGKLVDPKATAFGDGIAHA